MAVEAAASRRPIVPPAAGLRTASDQRLIEDVRAGSERAFEVVFDRYHDSVLAFCRRLLGSREEAEDAAQQTFLSAYRALAGGEQPRALGPWLYGIARHRCLSALRGRGRRSPDPVPERGADHLLAQVTTREDLRELFADVARLPFDQRAALILAELGDVSHEEIATIVGCPRAKVKALVFQARSSLTAGRAARELTCADVRQQLATLRGGALGRRLLRRHLHDCAGCRAVRDELRGGRRRLGLWLPALPLMIKRAVLGALTGSGGGAGGAALTAGALSAAGATAAAVVAVAIPGAPLADAIGPPRAERQPAGVAAAVTTTDRAAARASSSPRRTSVAREVTGRTPSSASPAAAPVRHRASTVADRPGDGTPRAAAPAGVRDDVPSTNHAAPVEPRSAVVPAGEPRPGRQREGARRATPPRPPHTPRGAAPARPPHANGGGAPRTVPRAAHRPAPAGPPPHANGHGAPHTVPRAAHRPAPAGPPEAHGGAAPAAPERPEHAPPVAPPDAPPGLGAAAEPPGAGAAPPGTARGGGRGGDDNGPPPG